MVTVGTEVNVDVELLLYLPQRQYRELDIANDESDGYNQTGYQLVEDIASTKDANRIA